MKGKRLQCQTGSVKDVVLRQPNTITVGIEAAGTVSVMAILWTRAAQPAAAALPEPQGCHTHRWMQLMHSTHPGPSGMCDLRYTPSTVPSASIMARAL